MNQPHKRRFPQGLKRAYSARLEARLKPRPFKPIYEKASSCVEVLHFQPGSVRFRRQAALGCCAALRLVGGFDRGFGSLEADLGMGAVAERLVYRTATAAEREGELALL